MAYVGQFAQIPDKVTVVNFFLPEDTATREAWNFNNLVLRPFPIVAAFVDPVTSELRHPVLRGYEYRPNDPPDGRLKLVLGGDYQMDNRFLTDPHEAMPYASKSPTQTVNADGAFINGRINIKVPMEQFGFTKEHAAQWEWPLPKAHLFYKEITKQLIEDEEVR